MKKSRFFKRSGLAQGTTATATAPVTGPKTDYAARFLKRRSFNARQSIYISQETHASVARLVHLLAMAGKEISVGGYIDNVVTEHLENHREFISEMRRQQLEQD